MNVLIFIPAKNEEEHLKQVINSTLQKVESVLNIKPETLIIDDGSTDKTLTIAIECGTKTIHHKTNLGLGVTFQEAVHFALNNDIDIMITIDGDGQFDTNDIPKLLEPIINNNAELVIGNRFKKNYKISNMPRVKTIGNYYMSKVVNLILKTQYQDVSCGFRVYTKEALLNLNLSGSYTYTHEVILNLGFKKIPIKEVDISVKYFKNRQSRLVKNLFSYGYKTIMIIIKSIIKYKPLKLFGSLSFFLLLISLPIFIWLSVRYFILGMITPYKAIGIISLILIIISSMSLLTGLFLSILSKLQLDIDKIIYYEKKQTRKK